MKKQFLFLAGCAVILASCGSNNNNAGQTQAQIDSTVNATMAQHDAANASKNDSTLKAIEKEKAEAIAKEHEAKHEEHEAKNAANGNNGAQPATPAPTPTNPAGGLKAHSDQSQSANPNSAGKPASGGGLKAHSDQSQGH